MALKPRKIPMRMCVGCREMKEKRELIRVVRNADGTVGIDRKGKMPGRGAYLCPNEECLKKAVKQRQLERALEVPIGEEVYGRLKEEVSSGE